MRVLILSGALLFSLYSLSQQEVLYSRSNISIDEDVAKDIDNLFIGDNPTYRLPTRLGSGGENQLPTSQNDIDKIRVELKPLIKQKFTYDDKKLNVRCSEAAEAFSSNGDSVMRINFINACLTDTLPDDKLFLNKFTANVVYLDNPTAPDPCTGLLLSKTLVLTALHCNPKVAFFSDGSVRSILKVKKCVPHTNEYCDYAFLTIQAVRFNPTPVIYRNPTQGHPLWIPGYAVEKVRGDLVGTDNPKPKLKWEKFNKSTCIVEYVRKGCFIHMCQVMSGYSGAPIIDVDETMYPQTINVVGIHVSSHLSDTSCSLDRLNPKSKVRRNFGYPINSMIEMRVSFGIEVGDVSIVD